jgi:hypothetical protein
MAATAPTAPNYEISGAVASDFPPAVFFHHRSHYADRGPELPHVAEFSTDCVAGSLMGAAATKTAHQGRKE